MSVDTLPSLREEFDCALCQSLLFNPVTTPCGHTFCRECVGRAMDHSNKCPICRVSIHVTHDQPVNILLQNVIKKLFEQEYNERAQELAALTQSTERIPLFLLRHVLLPGALLPLHIFEARYRLMIRRCMEGGRTFGILNDGNDVGTIAYIEEHRQLPDGRIIIETRGRRRFRVVQKHDQDGYITAEVEYIDDEDDPSTAPGIFLVKAELDQALDALGPRQALVQRHGAAPEDPKAFSFWVTNILLPIPLATKQRLLELTSTETRLEQLVDLVEGLRSDANTAKCVIQ